MAPFNSYFEHTEFSAEKIRFIYQRQLFEGRGVLRWDPSTGYKLDLLIDKAKQPVRITGSASPKRSDYVNIYLSPRFNGSRYVAISVDLASGFWLPFGHVKESPFAVFRVTRRNGSEFTNRLGSVLLRAKPLSSWPDVMRVTTRIGKKKISEHQTSAMSIDNTNMSLQVYPIENGFLAIHWKTSPKNRRHLSQWRWAIALQTVASILMNQYAPLCFASFALRTHDIEYKRHAPKPIDLGKFGLFATHERIYPGLFLRMVDFFYSRSPESRILLEAYERLTDAASQKSRAGREFMLASTFEGIVRSLINKRSKFPFEKHTKELLVKYGAQSEGELIDLAMKSFVRLRHPNAHPLWIAGRKNQRAMQESIDDMMTLTRFLTFLFFAIMGFKPRLPIIGKNGIQASLTYLSISNMLSSETLHKLPE